MKQVPVDNSVKMAFLLTSPMLISASVYCSPFIMMLRSAAGGTKAPLMFDWLI